MAEPDIKLLFGVAGDGGIDVAGTGAEIKARISEIVHAIERTDVVKIAFDVDEVTTRNNIENALRRILPTLQTNMTLNVNPVINTPPNAPANNLQQARNRLIRGSVNILDSIDADDERTISSFVQDIRDHIETETKKVTKMHIATQLVFDPDTKQTNFDVARAEVTEVNKQLGETSKHIYQIRRDASGVLDAITTRKLSTVEPEKYNKVFEPVEQQRITDEAEQRITKLSAAAKFLGLNLTTLNTMSRNIFDTNSLTAFNREFKTIENTINGTKTTFARTLNPIKSIENELKNFSQSSQKMTLDIGKISKMTPVSQLRIDLQDAELEANRLLNPPAGVDSTQRQRDLKQWQDRVNALRAEIKLLDKQQRATLGNINTPNQYANITTQLENYRIKYSAGINAVPGLNESFDALKLSLQQGDFADVKYARSAFGELIAKARDAGVQVETLGQKIKRLFGNNFASAIAAIGIHLITRNLGELYQNVVKIDTAMTQLRKVSDATFPEMAKVLDTATVKAVKLGVSISDLVTAAAGFARLGFNVIDSEKLGEAATILYNVGDELDSIEDATSAIVSSMYAFKINSSEVMTIVDKLNSLSNKFSISTGGAADALARSASSLATAGNDINQSLALIVGGNLITQDADMTGTALKTMALRLRSAKVELEDAGLETEAMASSTSKLREKILALTNVTGNGGFDILTDKGQFKSTYDMMEGISAAYVKMTDTVNQASLIELIAGKRTANVAASILTNFDTVSKAYQASINSEGSAFAEHAKWLDSIEGKTGQFTAQFQALSSVVINSKLAKTIISGGTGILSVLTQVINALGSLPALITTVAAVAASKGNIGNSNVNMPRLTSLSVAA